MEKDYGNVISKLRKQHKLTQQELGKRLNVSYQAVSKWENNQSQPDLQTLELLVDVFGISLNEFFEMANQKNVESVEPVVSQNIQTQSKLSTANGKFKKFMATPWFVVSILSVIVLVFGLIAIFVPPRYSKEQIYAKASDKIVSVNINGSNYTGFFIDSYGTAVFAYYQPLYINKATVSFNGSEKRYNITKILGCKDFFVVAQVDIKNSPCIKTSYKYNPKIEEKVYVMDIYNRTKLRIQECLVGQVNYSNGVNEFDLAGGSTFAVVLNARAQVVALTNTNAGGLTHAISISAINDIKRDNPRDLQVDIENSLSQYLIKYDANGGEGTMEDQICDVEGYYNLRLNKFIKTGYKFVCWKYLDKLYTDTQYVSQLAQAGETITLCAQWEPIQYQIEFDANGGEGTMEDQICDVEGYYNLRLNKFIKTGYKFVCWKYLDKLYTDTQYVSQLAQAGETITLYAQWEPITYEVVFCAEGQESYSQTMKYDQSYDLLPNAFVFKGQVFEYWQRSGTSAKYYDCQSVRNMTNIENDEVYLYAHTKDITYTVNYIYNDTNGNLVYRYSKQYEYSSINPVERFYQSLVAYKFDCWTDSNGNKYKNSKDIGDSTEEYITSITKLVDTQDGSIDLISVLIPFEYHIYITDPSVEQIYEVGTKKYNEYFYLTYPFETDFGYECVKYNLYRFDSTTQDFVDTGTIYYNNNNLQSTIHKEDGDILQFRAIITKIKYKIYYYYYVGASTIANNFRGLECEYGEQQPIKSFEELDFTLQGGDQFYYWIDTNGNKYKSQDDTGEYTTSICVEAYDGTKLNINLYAVVDLTKYHIYIADQNGENVYDCGEIEKYVEIKFTYPYEIPFGYEFSHYELYTFDSETNEYKTSGRIYRETNRYSVFTFMTMGVDVSGQKLQFRAVFTKIKYEVEFRLVVDDEVINTATRDYEYGSHYLPYDLPAFFTLPEGYEFCYWIDQDGNKYKNYGNPDEYITTIYKKEYCGEREKIILSSVLRKI